MGVFICGKVDHCSRRYIPIYLNSSKIGAVSGGRAASRRADDEETVGAGRIGLGLSLGIVDDEGGRDRRVDRRIRK